MSLTDSAAGSISRRSFLMALAGLAGTAALGLDFSDVATQAVTSTTSFSEEKLYRIYSDLKDGTSERVLDISGGNMADGTDCIIWGPNSSIAQCFILDSHSDGTFSIRTLHAAHNDTVPRDWKALDVENAVAANGTNVRQWTYNGTAAQRWNFVGHSDGTFEIVSGLNSNFCLDLPGGSAKQQTSVQLYTRNNTRAQRWRVEEYDLGWEPFSEKTDSTRFSALVTRDTLEAGDVTVEAAGGAKYRSRFIMSGTDTSKPRSQYIRCYYFPEGGKVTCLYPQVGTYYGEPVGARVVYSSPVITPKLFENGPEIFIPESFSAEDPAGLWIKNLNQVDVAVEFFYTDDPARMAIDIDLAYWTEDSLSYVWNDGDPGSMYMEYMGPRKDGGWTGHAYALPDSYSKAKQPCVFWARFGNSASSRVASGFYGLAATKLEYPWLQLANGITCAYSGKTLRARLGVIKKEDTVATLACIANRFQSLYKTEEVPIHFCVWDAGAASEDPAYSPTEVYQATWQKGDYLRRENPLFNEAAEALLEAYPTSVTDDDYWYSEKTFESRFSGLTVKTEIYIWARVSTGTVLYIVDGTDDGDAAFTDANVPAGPYSIPEKATSAALAETCNLDAHFGEEPSTGFTGWFMDKELVRPASDLSVTVGKKLRLYGRNRCTLRIEYAESSVEPGDSVFRKKPSDTAESVDAALGLIDFTGSAEAHRLDSCDLPVINDNGPAHAAFYRDESVSLAGATDVYVKTEGGTWRRVSFRGYFADKAGGGTPLDSIKMERDTTVYALWAYSESDGVAATKK